jgi:hypothetical protein
MSTYMPRNISNSKKYLAALSSVFSFSSQRFGRGSRKPGGGGPWGVAARAEVVEKRATVAGEGRRAVEAKGEGRSSADAGRLRASMLNGFVEAIVGCGGVVGGGRACRGFEVLVMSEVERGVRPMSLDRGDADWLGGYVRMGDHWELRFLARRDSSMRREVEMKSLLVRVL